MNRSVLLAALALSALACKKSEAEGVPALPSVQKEQGALASPTPAVTAAPSPTAPPPPTPAEPPPAVDWTTSKSQQKRDWTPPVVLKELRTARNDGFDRIVFEFAENRLPGFRVEYSDGPAQSCGSGDPVKVEGAARLIVELELAQAHDEQGKSTVKDTDRRLNLPVLLQAKQTCDFEGYVTWAFGLKAKRSYRVLELSSPARLVVDVRD
jgi:hypothetical protein